jgi:hypothetical protein
MGLNDLKPVVGKSLTTTTVTAGRDSSSSDEEKILDHSGRPMGRWNVGISKSVTTTVVEERTNATHSDRTPRREIPSTPTMERRRNGSPGGDSASTLGDDGHRGPVRAYGAF